MSKSERQSRRKRVRAARPHQRSATDSAHAEMTWRKADELLGASWCSKQEADAEVFEMPHDVAREVAAVTRVEAVPIDEFQSTLARICREVSSRATWISLIKTRAPLALLNRVSRAASQLSRDLMRLKDGENKSLDGNLIALFPRVIVRARADRGKIEVAECSWTLLQCIEYAHLLAGLAACAQVAASKADGVEIGRHLGVRLTFNEERYQEFRRSSQYLSSVRNEPLCVLILQLRDLIVREGQGKLSLWNDPVGGGVNGTLPAVLKILRPYLPDTIPVKLNYRTLHRYLHIKP